ncbi:MAG: MIP/aquaporin family protein [Bilifractor sp.]|jgi:glycerol uptake facilitator protein
MEKYLAEFLGCFLLILIGDGTCAGCNLNKSLFKNSGGVYIMIGWGLAVMIPAYCFGSISGAHFNPAVTLASCIIGTTPWGDLVPYIIAQLLGCMVGAMSVLLLYWDHFKETEDKTAILGTFCTRPAIRSPFRNFMSEFFCGLVLVFALDGITQAGTSGGVNWFLVYGVIMAIGFSLGSLTGFAINPARDFGPRLVHSLFPVPNKGDSNWSYVWVPILGPTAGGIVGALLYTAVF